MLSNVSITQLLIVLVIVICIFGTKRFRQAGGDLGAMVRGIKDGFGSSSVDELVDDIADAKKQVKNFKEKLQDGSESKVPDSWHSSEGR